MARRTRVPSPRPSFPALCSYRSGLGSPGSGCPGKLHGSGRGAGPWLRRSGPPPPRTAWRGNAVRPRPPDGAQAPRKREAAPGPPPQREQCGASGCSAARDPEPGAQSPERGRLSERSSGRAGGRGRGQASAQRSLPKAMGAARRAAAERRGRKVRGARVRAWGRL